MINDRRAQDALKVLQIAEQAGYQARLAGGCVRDRLMGAVPVDFDVATNASPDQATVLFRTKGYKVVPTGVDHGTVTIIAPSGPIEVTTLRRDVATDGRRAQVAFGESFEEDAERRDFTINAMFEDARGQIYDYFGGLEDLKSGHLRFVGDASTRIREDYLRILRLFRFWSKLGFNPVPGTLDAVTSEKAGLTSISQERITSELMKTLSGEFAPGPVKALHASGVWHLVLPELLDTLPSSYLPQDFWPLSPEISHQRRGLAVLTAASFWEWRSRDSKAWTDLAMRLRLPKTEVRAFMWFPLLLDRLKGLGNERADQLLLCEESDHHAGPDSCRVFYGPILEALAKAGQPEAKAISSPLASLVATDTKWGHLRHNAPPVSGKEAMTALGIAQGPLLGELLSKLRRAYLNGEWSEHAQGLKILTMLKDNSP